MPGNQSVKQLLCFLCFCVKFFMYKVSVVDRDCMTQEDVRGRKIKESFVARGTDSSLLRCTL